MSETPQNSFQNFLQLIAGLLLDLCASKMMYGHLEIRANSLSAKQCNKCCTTTLGNMSKLPENSTTPSPQFMCLNNSHTDRADCTESIQYIMYFLAQFPCLFPAVWNSKIHIVQPLCSECTLPQFLCLICLLYGLLYPYSATCIQWCTCCLNICAR